MECQECGRTFRPSGHGKPAKYCSGACKARAYRRRKKNEPGPAGGKPEAGGERATKADRATGDGKPLTRVEFNRMMDVSLEDTLRSNRDRLQRAMDDMSTPANALPAISRQIIAISERLEQMGGAGGLFDEDEDTEVGEDAGASFV